MTDTTDTTDRDILLGAVEDYCEKRVRDAVLAERTRIVKHIRECAALPSMRAHHPELAWTQGGPSTTTPYPTPLVP